MMKDLYAIRDLRRWQKRAGRFLTAAVFVAVYLLALCIGLCFRVNTATAEILMYIVFGVSVLAGWAVILLIAFGYLPARAEVIHREGMLGEEATEVTGVLTIDRQKWVIPHSIAFCKACIVNGEEKLSCQADAALLRQLPPDGTRIRAVIRRKFITAWEVQDEEA